MYMAAKLYLYESLIFRGKLEIASVVIKLKIVRKCIKVFSHKTYVT